MSREPVIALPHPELPDGFVLGAATSAYQIEGATGEDGRGPSIWDTFARRPGATRDGRSGDVACEHYHRFREDVGLVAELGLDAYRFSIAWPRVQPDGKGAWNEAGWDFYARLLDALAEADVEPWVTLYHWDLPQALEDAGGWRSRDTAHRFAEYAAEFARRLGERVRWVATHNEPLCTATLGHETGEHAPGWRDRRAAAQVSHHVLLSHGLALRALRAEGYRENAGIVLNLQPAYPADPESEADRALARREDGRWNRWYLDPLFLGAYPTDVLEALGADAPAVAEGDLAVIGQRMDFLGVNYYNRSWCSAAVPPVPAPCPYGRTAMGWEIYPDGLTELLVRVARGWHPPPMYVTENGAALDDALVGGRVHDRARIEYIAAHLAAAARARALGADVRGYFAWSLLDNFEWAHGYTQRFGLVHVDYETQRRVPKDSALWLRDLAEGRRRGGAGG